MSWRTTGILFVILLVVGGVVFWQARQLNEEANTLPTASAPVQQSQTVSLFPEVALQQIARIDISQGADGAEASFRHDESGAWYMTVPTSTQVLSTTLTPRITGLLNATSRRNLLPDENPLSAYGLDDPQGTITVAVRRENDTALYRVQVGNETPSGDAYYLLKAGDPRVLIVAKLTLDNIFNLAEEPPIAAPTPEVTLPLTGTVPITGSLSLPATVTPAP